MVKPATSSINPVILSEEVSSLTQDGQDTSKVRVTIEPLLPAGMDIAARPTIVISPGLDSLQSKAIQPGSKDPGVQDTYWSIPVSKDVKMVRVLTGVVGLFINISTLICWPVQPDASIYIRESCPKAVADTNNTNKIKKTGII